MKVTLERLPESRVLLDIEVDPDRLEKSLEVAYKRVASKARIPGFRPGKAPRRIVERMIGREGLIREALDDLVPNVYNEVIQDEDVDAVDQPELEIVELDPVRFKATVPVRHSVDLGDYKSVKVQREVAEVTPEMVEEQIEGLRRRFANQVPVERAAEWNDILIADVVSTVDEDEPFVEDRDAEFQLREGAVLLLPGLAEAFHGMERDQEKQIDLEIPEDFQVERLQGKTAHFTLTLKDVKEEQLPEVDDDFAQQVNEEEFPTIQALRERIEKDLKESLENAANSQLQQQAIDKIVEIATLEYPRIYVEREIDAIVRDQLGNDRQQYTDYLSRLGQSEAEFRESQAEAAELRVKRSLVMTALADAEGIEITDEEIEAELDRIVEPAGDEAGALREIFASEDGRATIRRNLLSDRTLARLVELTAVDGPVDDSEASAPAEDADSPDEDETATAKKEDEE